MKREYNKEEGVGRIFCIVFQIWGSLQRALPRSPEIFASLPLKCIPQIFCLFVSSGIGKVVLFCLSLF